MTTRINIRTGQLLMAEPYSRDPYFSRAAVLLCDHHQQGTFGLILNKLLDVSITELVPEITGFDAQIHYGGPVQLDSLHFLHNVGDLISGTQQVTGGIWWGGDFDELKFMISSGLITPDNVRFFIGYSGWSSGQLADEMEIGSWITTDMHANYLYKVPPDQLWRQAVYNKGDLFEILADMPEEAYWN